VREHHAFKLGRRVFVAELGKALCLPLDVKPFDREIESGWEPVEDLPVDYK
jgi:hypothetical protein